MTWIQIEKLAKAYMKNPGLHTAEALDSCLKECQEPVKTFARLFVQPVIGAENTTACFQLSENGYYPDWACHYDIERNTFLVNIIGVIKFQSECQCANMTAKTQEGRENFKTYRLLAYMHELQKIPFKLMCFICLFREVARVTEVTKIDKRRSNQLPPTEAEESYMCYLWAFKALENALKRVAQIDLRADYNITWYESEWITVNS